MQWSNKLCPIAEILYLKPNDISLQLGFRIATDHFSRNSNSHCSLSTSGVSANRRENAKACMFVPVGSLADAGVWMSMATGILLENCRFGDN